MSSIDPTIDSATASVPPDLPANAVRSGGMLRWIATSNPFYVISAALFLVGLRVSFTSQSRDIDSWALMIGLASYTLLLGAAALLLVRFARVWNDVRTVLLLVVLMFLATSVTFDELLVMNPDRGRLFCLGGLFFSILVSECLLRGIQLSLPSGFRIPYYLTLALFFLYPLAIIPVVRDAHSETLMWRLFLFSTIAGAIFLTLIPAIRRGPRYLRNNGSPWPWPFYPWSLFVFLAVAVVGRSFLLCWSFHLLESSNLHQLIFGFYFIVPFGFALAIILLELGIVARQRIVSGVAICVPIGLVAFASTDHQTTGIYQEFLELFSARLGGSPLYLATLVATGFYVYAALRRIRFAPEFLTATIALLAFVGPATYQVTGLTLINPGFLVGVVLLQGVLGLWRRDAWRIIAATAVIFAWATGFVWRLYITLRAEVAGLDYLIVGLFLLPVAVVISLAKAGVLPRWLMSSNRRSVGSTDES